MRNLDFAVFHQSFSPPARFLLLWLWLFFFSLWLRFRLMLPQPLVYLIPSLKIAPRSPPHLLPLTLNIFLLQSSHILF